MRDQDTSTHGHADLGKDDAVYADNTPLRSEDPRDVDQASLRSEANILVQGEHPGASDEKTQESRRRRESSHADNTEAINEWAERRSAKDEWRRQHQADLMRHVSEFQERIAKLKALRQRMSDLKPLTSPSQTSPEVEHEDQSASASRPETVASQREEEDVRVERVREMVKSEMRRYAEIYLNSAQHADGEDRSSEPGKSTARMSAGRRENQLQNAPTRLEDACEYSIPYFFGGFSKRSPVRIKCFEMYYSYRWNGFFTVVTAINSIAIIVQAEVSSASRIYSILNNLNDFCLAVLGLEVFVGIVAMGLIQNKHAWLRLSAINCLEFVIFFSTIALMSIGNHAGIVLPFRLIRLLKVLARFKTFDEINLIILTITEGSIQLASVFFMLLFFMLAFCIFLMAMLRNSFRRYCVVFKETFPVCASGFSEQWAPTCDFTQQDQLRQVLNYAGAPQLVVGGYPYLTWCKIYYNITPGQYDTVYPLDYQGQYHDCGMNDFANGRPVNQFCKNLENPSYGFSHYDNIAGALMNLFQSTCPDSYYDVIWRSLESEPEIKPILLLCYFLISCLCTFLMLGIFVAVVTGTFSNVKERSKEIQKEQEMERIETERSSQNSKVHPEPVSWENLGQEEDFENVVQHVAKSVCQSESFKTFQSCVILYHSIAMAINQRDSPQPFKTFATLSYWIVNSVFLVLLVIKYFSYDSFGDFWDASANKFEMLLIACGWVGSIISSPFFIRIPSVRLYYLMDYFPALQYLLYSALSSIRAVWNLTAFIFVLIVSFAVAGRYIFGTSMDPITRSNFGSLPIALLTTFQLVIGDSWSGVVYSGLDAMEGTFPQLGAAVYLIGWFTFASLIISNLFVATIIENFKIHDTVAKIAQPGRLYFARKMIKDAYRNLWLLSRQSRMLKSMAEVPRRSSNLSSVEQSFSQDLLNQIKATKHKRFVLTSNFVQVAQKSLIRFSYNIDESKTEEEERTLMFFNRENKLRKVSIWLARQAWFDLIVYNSIFLSCILLTLTPPAPDIYLITDFPVVISSSTSRALTWFLNIIFTLEFTVRAMEHGLIFTKKAYFKDGWNLLDFTVLFLSWIDETGLFKKGNTGKVIRLARALRPLRLMKRNEGLRLVIDALIRTLAPVIYVIIFTIFTFMVFGLIGMGLFGGKFKSCNNPSVAFPQGKGECLGWFLIDNGIAVPSSWQNPRFDFDTFGNSVETLFQVMTFKYVNVIYQAMDVTDVDLNPEINYSVYNGLFFVAYLIIGGLFVMNLFVGFIIDGFNANKGSSEKDIIFSRFNRQLYMYRPKYFKGHLPQNAVSIQARKLLAHRYFDIVSSLCVLINVTFMLVDHAGASQRFENMIASQNNFFFAVLVLEVCINLIGFGPGAFIYDNWKTFDLIIALGSSAGYMAQNDKVSQFSKSFRLFRIFKLMKMITPIRIILETLISCLPQLANIVLLLVLVYSIFAVSFVQMFGTTRNGVRLGPTASFFDYGSSLMTILQIVTGDEWQELVKDCAVQPPYCTAVFDDSVHGWSEWKPFTLSFGDCGQSYSFLAFVVMKLVCEKVMLNLFIGMILDNFGFFTEEVGDSQDGDWSTGPTTEQTQLISQIFSLFDRQTGRAPISVLHRMMCVLPYPFGYRGKNGELVRNKDDDAVELLIRSELNVLVRLQRDMRIVEKTESWKRFIPLFLLSADVSETIMFEDYMRTIFFWRKHDLIPDMVRIMRNQRVDEVIFISYVILIVDFLKRAVGDRKRQQDLHMIQQLRAFRHWERGDASQSIRNAMVRDLVKHEKDVAKRLTKPLILLHVPATSRVKIELQSFDAEHFEVYEHADVIEDPALELETFMHMVTRYRAVLQFVDPIHAVYGVVAADLSGCSWKGWKRQEDRGNTLFRPSSFERSEYDKDWESISIAYNVDTATAARPTYLILGELTDLMCSTWYPGRLLLNLGLTRYEFLYRNLVADAGRGELAAGTSMRSVLRVIGYAPLKLKFKDEQQLPRRKVLVNQDVEVEAM